MFLSLCSVYVEAAIFTQNKTNKTHINLNFFSLNEEKKKLCKGLKANPSRRFSMIDPGQRCDTQNRVA